MTRSESAKRIVTGGEMEVNQWRSLCPDISFQILQFRGNEFVCSQVYGSVYIESYYRLRLEASNRRISSKGLADQSESDHGRQKGPTSCESLTKQFQFCLLDRHDAHLVGVENTFLYLIE